MNLLSGDVGRYYERFGFAYIAKSNELVDALDAYPPYLITGSAI